MALSSAHRDAIEDARRRVNQAGEDLVEVVEAARREGASWTWIGEALGMSKQAAWKRFGGR